MSRLLIFFSLFFALITIADLFEASRASELKDLDQRWSPQHPLSSTGPFKGILMDIWWYDVHRKLTDYQFEEAGKLSAKICRLQPYYADAWRAQSKILGLNIMAEAPGEREERLTWLIQALDLLKEGYRYHPDHPSLLRFNAWMIYIKYVQGYGPELDQYYGSSALKKALEYQSLSDPIGAKNIAETKFLIALAYHNREKELMSQIVRRAQDAFPEESGSFKKFERQLNQWK